MVENGKEGDTESCSRFRQHEDEPGLFSGVYVSPLDAHHCSSNHNHVTGISNIDSRPHYCANCEDKAREETLEILEDDVHGRTGTPLALQEGRMRYAADGGIRLAGGRLGEAVLEDSDITSEVSVSTMPPPYLSIPFP